MWHVIIAATVPLVVALTSPFNRWYRLLLQWELIPWEPCSYHRCRIPLSICHGCSLRMGESWRHPWIIERREKVVIASWVIWLWHLGIGWGLCHRSVGLLHQCLVVLRNSTLHIRWCLVEVLLKSLRLRRDCLLLGCGSETRLRRCQRSHIIDLISWCIPMYCVVHV